MTTVKSPSGEALRKDSLLAQEGYDWQTDHSQKLRQMNVLDAASCVSPGQVVQSSKSSSRKDGSLFEIMRMAIVQHQLGLSINCLLLLALTHLFFPGLRHKTTPFFTLSHGDARTGLYHPGREDFKFVCLWIVIFTGLRAGTMDYILIPWARSAGIQKKKAAIRFAEQGWLLLYVSVFWSVGMYLYSTSSYFASLPALWADFPNPAMRGLLKWYYLAQFGFWLQQIVVVNIEDKRKDHWQMFAHHIITSLLILVSYGYYQTSVGNVILCIMDVVDLLLPTAKMLKYLGYQTACDIAFGLFILTWFIARHVLYLAVCWSIYADVPNVKQQGCYDPLSGELLTLDGGHEVLSNIFHAFGDTSKPVCFNEHIRGPFLGLLLFLQVITLVWFGMICRVAYSVLKGKGADDSRSDDEGEDAEEEIETGRQTEKHQQQRSTPPSTAAFNRLAPKEEEVGVEELSFVRRSSPPKTRKSKGRASGISIPGHGDHKELLGRIGCDKPSGS